MRRNLIISVAALFMLCAASVSAQDFSKSVEVTKAYIPTVNGATKISAVPRMDDTVRLQPDIDYSIKPVTCFTTFTSRRITPAVMSSNPYYASTPSYLAFALGYPFRTYLDLYVNNKNNSEQLLGGYINHRGSFSRRKNDLDTLLNATSIYNAVGFFGSRRWDRISLGGDVNYENRLLHRYGVFTDSTFWGAGHTVDTLSLLPTAKQSVADYGKVWGKINAGNDFEDLSLLNWGTELTTSFSHDKHGSEMATFGASARVAQMFREKHGFDVSLTYNGYWGMSRLDSVGSQTFVIAPRYMFRSRYVNMNVGVDYGYRNSRGFDLSHSRVFPYLDLSVNMLKGYVVPFVQADGRFIDGSFDALSHENPYIAVGTVAPTGSVINLAAGISGSALQCLSYRAWFGFSAWENMHYFVSLYKPVGSQFSNSFGVLTDDAEQYTIGAELEYMYSGSLTLKLDGHYYAYILHNLPDITNGGNPTFDAALSVSYKYRDKLSLSVETRVIGPRRFYQIANAASPVMKASEVGASVNYNKAPVAVDLNVEFAYRLTGTWWIYAQGSNLANSRLYPYNHYRALGTALMLGFRTSF